MASRALRQPWTVAKKMLTSFTQLCYTLLANPQQKIFASPQTQILDLQVLSLLVSHANGILVTLQQTMAHHTLIMTLLLLSPPYPTLSVDP